MSTIFLCSIAWEASEGWACGDGAVGLWQPSADRCCLGTGRQCHGLCGSQRGVDEMLGGGQRALQGLGNFSGELRVHIGPELPQTGVDNTLRLVEVVEKTPHLRQAQHVTLS